MSTYITCCSVALPIDIWCIATMPLNDRFHDEIETRRLLGGVAEAGQPVKPSHLGGSAVLVDSISLFVGVMSSYQRRWRVHRHGNERGQPDVPLLATSIHALTGADWHQLVSLLWSLEVWYRLYSPEAQAQLHFCAEAWERYVGLPVVM